MKYSTFQLMILKENGGPSGVVLVYMCVYFFSTYPSWSQPQATCNSPNYKCGSMRPAIFIQPWRASGSAAANAGHVFVVLNFNGLVHKYEFSITVTELPKHCMDTDINTWSTIDITIL